MSPLDAPNAGKWNLLRRTVDWVSDVALDALPAVTSRPARADGRNNVSFEVVAGDSEAEILLIDGEFRLVDRATGVKTFSVPAGLYKLKQICGNAVHEQLLIVREGMKSVELPRVAFASAIPLANTSQTHEFHMSAAVEASARIDHTNGVGSGIALIVRDWTSSDEQQQNAVEIPDPSRGLKLRDVTGAVIADYAVMAKKRLEKEPWATCHLSVAPGFYRLSLDHPDGLRVEQTIVACPGWDTYIYLLMDRTTTNPPTGADLVNGAITMLPTGTPFNPGDQVLRAEELLRLALVEGNSILSDKVRAQVTGARASPMLALLGAHLLIREAKSAKRTAEEHGVASNLDNTPAVRTIVANLRRALGDHPDVEAIAIRAGARNPNYLFSTPPMLRESWARLVRASVDDPSVIPVNSLNGRISDRLWGDGPWLLWIDPDQQVPEELTPWHEAALEILQNLQEFPVSGAVGGIQTDNLNAINFDAAVVADAAVADAAVVAGGATSSGIAAGALAVAKNLPKDVLSSFRQRSRRPFPKLEESLGETPELTSNTAASLREVMRHPEARKEIVRQIGVPVSTIDAWLDAMDR
jgi:hypothetical protein